MSILKTAPSGATVLDLGAGRVARAEVRAAAGDVGSYLHLTAGFVQVRPEFALTVAFDLQAERIREGLSGLLVDPTDLDALLEDGLTAPDLGEIVKFVTGKTVGESLASPTS